MITPRKGSHWWLYDYEDGTVWPCNVLSVSMFGARVEPVAPAPDAGEQRTVSVSRVLDHTGKTPLGA